MRRRAALALSLLLPLSCAEAQQTPTDDLPPPERIQELADAGKGEEALALCRRFIEARPKDPFGARKELAILLELGRFDDALDSGHRSLRRFRRDALLLERLALASQRKAEQLAQQPSGRRKASLHLQDAVRFAERAVKSDPKRRESLAVLGMAQFQLGKVPKALQTATQLVERFPKSPTGTLLRAQIRLTMFTNGIRAQKLSDKERFLLAGQIRKDCELAARLDDSRHLPHRLLGDVAAWLGETDEARSRYASALARDPSRGAPHDWLLEQGAFAAHACYTKAIAELAQRKDKEARDEAVLQWYRGLAAFRAEDWEGTRAAMARCYSLESTFVGTLYYGALASYEVKKPDEALFFALVLSRKGRQEFTGELGRAGDEQERQTEIFRFLAKRAKDKGDLAGSRDINRCIAPIADDADTWNNHAFLCRETGEYEESWRSYNRALEKSPEDPQLLNDAAVILQYHLHRDLDRARKMYEKAIANAEKILEERKLSPSLLARAAQSMKDARGNLAEMDKARDAEKDGEKKK